MLCIRVHDDVTLSIIIVDDGSGSPGRTGETYEAGPPHSPTDNFDTTQAFVSSNDQFRDCNLIPSQGTFILITHKLIETSELLV